MGTHHKTGTMWMASTFRAIARQLGLRFVQGDHRTRRPSQPWDIFHNDHSQFDLEALGDFRGLHVIRDPRDQIVSATFYHLRATEEWLHVPREQFDGRSYHEMISSLEDFDHQLLFEMENSASFDIGHMRSFDYGDPRFMTVKYEDLIVDDTLTRFEEVFRFLGFSDQALKTCLSVAYNKALFSGEVKSKHVRSGKPRQWPQYFRPVHKARFAELFGDVLDQLQYEEGEQWRAR